jgi:hypothetical protein
MKNFAIFKRHKIKGCALRGDAEFEWSIDNSYLPREKAEDLRREYMTNLDPDLQRADDSFIKLHWQRWTRNVGGVKIKKINN